MSKGMRMDLGVYEAYTLLQSGRAVLVDVRSPAEFAAEHVAGAVNVPLDKVTPARVRQVVGDKLALMMCQSGMRSGTACGVLGEIEEVRIVAGGMNYWRVAGLPVERAHRDRWHTLPLERRVQVVVGLLVGVFSLLALLVSPWFALGSLGIGAGLLNAGLTGWCGMGKILARL